MKRFAMAMAVVLTIGVSFVVQAAEKSVDVTVDVALLTKYIGGLSGSTIFDEPVIQPLVAVTHKPTGLYAKGWASYSPRGGFDSDFGDEFDIYTGVKKTFAGFTFDFGVAYYNTAKFGSSKEDFYGIYLITDFPTFAGITPYLWLEGDGPINGAEGGYLYRAGLRYGFEVCKLPLGIEASLAGHDGAYGTHPELVSSARLSIFGTVKVWKIGITPLINFQKSLGHAVENGGMTKDEVWGGINLSYQF